MNDSAWHWARLDRKGIALVQETESELECLQGVESKLGIVAVAYSRAH